MIGLPIRLMPLVWAGATAGLAIFAFWLTDLIGDRREAKVRAEYAEAARVKNVDITKFNTAQEAMDAVVDAKVQEALAASKKVASELRYSAEQAAAVTAIRRAGQ